MNTTENIIVLRSVYAKAGGTKTPMKYFISPSKDPKTGRYPSCIRKVNSTGDMILSQDDINNNVVVIPEDKVFEITDGTTFDLSDPFSAAEWEAIKHCPLIAPRRDAKDANGNLIIDGPDNRNIKSYAGLQTARYGKAELYIEEPEAEAQRKVSKKALKHKASSFVFEDSLDGMITKCRLLGSNMKNSPSADVQDFLLEIAERDPQKIINLYTGEDLHLRLLLIDAKEKRSIILKNGVYLYADNIVLGATDDAVLTWMKQPKNLKVLELIKKDTHPEIYGETAKTSENLLESDKWKVSSTPIEVNEVAKKTIEKAKQTKAIN